MRLRNHQRRGRELSRKQFLLQVAGAVATAPVVAHAAESRPKVLLVVAHPDDEYAFAATVYRITHELGGTVDQLVITNGEAGYRYSRLAESFYGVALTDESVGRNRLPAIRKEETQRAGRILGIRKHYFLDQQDARFTLDGGEAFSGIWDVQRVRARILDLHRAEQYEFAFVLLPTEATHGHHQAAALFVLQAVAQLPEAVRPVVLGSEASGESAPQFGGRPDFPLMRLASGSLVHSVSRDEPVSEHTQLTYSIVVNWVIAEHKSQGLFQTECGKHSHENFWTFDTGTPGAVERTKALFALAAARRSRNQ